VIEIKDRDGQVLWRDVDGCAKAKFFLNDDWDGGKMALPDNRHGLFAADGKWRVCQMQGSVCITIAMGGADSLENAQDAAVAAWRNFARPIKAWKEFVGARSEEADDGLIRPCPFCGDEDVAAEDGDVTLGIGGSS